MTGRQRLEAMEQRTRLINRARGRCEVCGKMLVNPQVAHRVPQHKRYLRRYGKAVIHHPLNLKVVCSLRCNSAVLLDPATHPIEAEELIQRIKEDLHVTDGA
jgi:uncharacterized membrane protein YccC